MYRKALKINETYGLKYEMAYNFRELAFIHSKRGELKQAKAMFQKAQKLFEELGNQCQLEFVKEQLGELH